MRSTTSSVASRAAAVAIVVVLVAGIAVLTTHDTDPAAARPVTIASTTTTLTTTTSQVLVPWTGPVEHLFFHTVVIRPDLAFADDDLGDGFRDYFVTVGELRAILEQLYDNGWTLVDIHRVAAGTVRVPPGRRPLVLSEDDVNYYDYSRPRGLGWRLVLDEGRVRVEVRDEHGTRVTDQDLVPMIDAFVAEHPDFSADGAKGILAVTGYEGVLGERLDSDASIARATRVAEHLKASGWTFASHSYGHPDLSTRSADRVQRDAERWQATIEPIVGPTDVYVYPFGAAPGPSGRATLRDAGFTIHCSIDSEPRLATIDGVTIMTRRHIDGIAFDGSPARLAPFFDVTAVIDEASRRRGVEASRQR